MLIVAKFGGSSVANTTQFKKVKHIVCDTNKKSDCNRNAIVVSALGKKEQTDSKVTDLLYLLHAHLKYNVPYDNIWSMIKTRFFKIKEDLNLSFDLEKEFTYLKEQLKKDISVDYLVSRGEYITGKLMAEYLNYKFVDAADVIKFNYDGTVNYELSYELIDKAFIQHEKVVFPGFYGVYPNNTYKTFSRGGSDITGAIVASALQASFYENWTDVSGILMADPKVIKKAKTITEITYSELRELSYMGANVLHEQTVFPVQKAHIPIKILNTDSPDDIGTIIREDCQDKSQVITGIAGKKNFTSFTITKNQQTSKISVIRDVLKIFDNFKVNIEHIPSAIDSFSVVVPSSDIENNLYDLVTELKKLEAVQDVVVDKDISLIAVVGRNMVEKPGMSGKIFGIVGNHNINIKMIAQGSQEINIIVGVSNNDFEKTIQALYADLVE